MKSESGNAAWCGWEGVIDGVRSMVVWSVNLIGKILIYPTTDKVLNLECEPFYLSIVFNRVKQYLTFHSTSLVQRTIIYLPLYLCDRILKNYSATYDITQETNYMKIL